MAELWEAPIDTGEVPDSGSEFDVIVVGGGPGGSAAAGYAAIDGCKVLLLEKAIWPRDKACGDAVGGKSLEHVTELGVRDMIEATPHTRVTGITFSSADGTVISIPLPEEDFEKKEAGYTLPRIQFDYMMFKRAAELVREAGGSVIQGFEVTEVVVEGGDEPDEKLVSGIRGKVGGRRSASEVLGFTAPLTIGAGGYNCPVAREITEGVYGEPMRDPEELHYCAAYREYWKNVGGCEGYRQNIEIHFTESILPGYFWIFPSGNYVNVGIGMVIHEMKKRKVNLKKMQADLIANHPQFKHRFADATLVEKSGKGWQLPFGSPRKKPPSFQPRRVSMGGALCIGDAAALVDPFSGEGIGNALVSAKMAVEHFDRELHQDGFSLSSARAYQVELWKRLGPELINSHRMQYMVRRKRLMNLFMRKAKRKPEMQDALVDMLASKEAQERIHSPWFWIKSVLF